MEWAGSIMALQTAARATYREDLLDFLAADGCTVINVTHVFEGCAGGLVERVSQSYTLLFGSNTWAPLGLRAGSHFFHTVIRFTACSYLIAKGRETAYWQSITYTPYSTTFDRQTNMHTFFVQLHTAYTLGLSDMPSLALAPHYHGWFTSPRKVFFVCQTRLRKGAVTAMALFLRFMDPLCGASFWFPLRTIQTKGGSRKKAPVTTLCSASRIPLA